ncbi:hypothetical protein [Alteromonas macleodii]|uniref:KfrA N-terminal DNA-binding domain-containing protein n=1 Tax=Alteromonas macleodii TaxID=28108 RepID=A0AB36FMQ1_ALTMA|nr:hypothetical protein [Alteromonas macleodii]OES24458.1 hypothetical protein BFV95_4725 [Alteromonas macleodii]OES25515.1 hypothetical protein BFV94_4368 [Alteromonas macleodii]OES25818.1 hypothetical protein BFV93_4281 [Alteromonas macleodii]OES38663.1 hypothetical protein BFV96_4774 [Alteromonas macleodii]
MTTEAPQEKKKAVSFEDVENVANNMLTKGLTPSVNAIMDVTGGRRENVAGFLRDFWDKRDETTAKIADEIGSSEIGKLLAAEMHTIVLRRGPVEEPTNLTSLHKRSTHGQF